MSSARIPPGPKPNFFLGHAPAYQRGPLDFLTRCQRDHGDVVRIHMPGFVAYLLFNPEHIEYVLRGNHRNFRKDRLTRRLSPLLGQGLLTSEGDYWRQQRQRAQPSFQLSQLQKYGSFMVGTIDRLMQTWTDGATRDLHRDMTAATLGIIVKVLFDNDRPEIAEEVGRALDELTDFFTSPFNYAPLARFLPTPAAVRYHRAVRRLNRVLYILIEQHRQKKEPGDDLLSRLLARPDDGGVALSDRQLRDELVTLFLAGLETTALTLSFGLYLLARHPEAEARWRTELAAVLGDRLPTTADVPKLVYTEWVVRESMRLYPPAWMIAREPLADCEIGGYPVRQGVQLWMVQWVVHRDPRWFHEPDVFRPERWDKEFVKRLPRGAYFPFGDGPRICIGNHFAMLEAVLLLASIGQRFQFRLPAGFELSLAPSVTLRPAKGVPMVLSALNKNARKE